MYTKIKRTIVINNFIYVHEYRYIMYIKLKMFQIYQKSEVLKTKVKVYRHKVSPRCYNEGTLL